METDIPTTTGGNTEGWSKGEITGVCLAVIAFIGVVIAVLTFLFSRSRFKKAFYSCLRKCCPGCQRSADENQSPDQIEMRTGSTTTRNAPESDKLLSPAVLIETSELEANGYTELDQKSPNRQAGCGDGQAVEAENRDMFYDIYLVSTSENTDHVKKIKAMCRDNGWKFTTPFGKLGMLPMQSRQKAVETSSHVVLVITKDDCLMPNVKDSLTIEMAVESVENGEIGGKVIPIRCCDRDSLPLLLRSLVGTTIDDDDLEARMKITIDKGIRREREAQCRSMSGAQGVRDGEDVAGGRDGPDSASAAISDTM